MLAATFTTFASAPLRESYNLNEGWRFYFASALDGSAADYVSLPHTWNVEAEEGDYLRTTGHYLREMEVPSEWEGRRLFLRFGGAQSVAQLFVNGNYVGEHRGGFTAFVFEITDVVRYGQNNYLRVVVSNAQRGDVLPLSSDINLAGGIYRDVELEVTPQDIISPLYYATEGVLVEQRATTRDRAEGVVRVYISAKNLDHTTVNMRIVGEDGYEVTRRTVKASKLADGRAVEIPFEVVNPQLWSPSHPTMYDVEVTLGDERKPLDSVVVRTGLRSIAINEDNKLLINGEPCRVKGVNLAHDRYGVGTALRREHLAEDFVTIRDMGANAIRSITGPHDDYLYRLTDEQGMLVWVDVPFSRSEVAFSDIAYYPAESLRENGFEQLREVVMQNYNHPSVVMWGLFSLVWQRGDDVVGYVGELNDLAHKLDVSRPTVGCSNSDGDINFVTDLVALRQNVGWMKGSVEDVDIWCGQLISNKRWEQLRPAVCYGEAGVRGHNAECIERATRHTRHFPERRQSDMHERYIEQIDEADIFWGVWLDNMFDYASSRRAYGRNLAGMVDYNHRDRKDAYYLYRARWNESVPTLHIADRGWSEREAELQTIDIYSSVGAPQLIVGSDTVATRSVGRAHYRADSVVVRTRTTIRAVSSDGRYGDSIVLR